MFFPSPTRAPCITVVPRGTIIDPGAQLALIDGDDTWRITGDIVPRTVKVHRIASIIKGIVHQKYNV